MNGILVTYQSTTSQHHSQCLSNKIHVKCYVEETHITGDVYKVERENQVAMTCHTKLHETASHRKLVADKLMQAHQDIEVRERLADTC